ncbi:MAG: GatB/YqeY domain-containing protein, partial [Parcubacteria group bacterium]|nr:GatB/YqeY domain-containing protein [Parcubacteria group bacterium]
DIIRRAVKQRKDSIEQFKKGGREDLVKSEESELIILQTYLPQMMSVDEIKKVVETKKTELGITDKSKVGLLMSAIMKELKGKADGGDVKKIVEELFK